MLGVAHHVEGVKIPVGGHVEAHVGQHHDVLEQGEEGVNCVKGTRVSVCVDVSKS